jgi:hypothetical protein
MWLLPVAALLCWFGVLMQRDRKRG